MNGYWMDEQKAEKWNDKFGVEGKLEWAGRFSTFVSIAGSNPVYAIDI